VLSVRGGSPTLSWLKNQALLEYRFAESCCVCVLTVCCHFMVLGTSDNNCKAQKGKRMTATRVLLSHEHLVYRTGEPRVTSQVLWPSLAGHNDGLYLVQQLMPCR